MGIFEGLSSQSWHQKLLARAKNDGLSEGKASRPAPSSAPYDAMEAGYRAEAQGLILKANERLGVKLRPLAAKLSEQEGKLAQAEASADFRKSPEEFESDAPSIREEYRTKLVKAHKELLIAEGHFNAFKALHDVTHAPNHPKDLFHFLTLIYVILALEAVANGVAWATSDAGGFAGGFITALFLAMINIGIGVLCGLGVRYFNRKDAYARTIALISAGFGAIFCVGLNAFIGAKRAKLDMERAGQLINLGENTAALMSDVNAMILFSLGVLFFALAAWKGYGMLGSIPGYKAVADDYDRAHEAVERLQEGVRSALREPLNKEMSEVQALARKITEAGEKVSEVSTELKQSKGDFDILASWVEGALQVISETYRQNNAAARPTNIPVPGYFSEKMHLDAQPNAQLSELISKADLLRERVDLLSVTKLPELQQRLASLKSALSTALGDSLSQFFQGAQHEARERYIAEIPRVKEV